MTDEEFWAMLDEIAAEIAEIKAWQAEIERKFDYAPAYLSTR